MKTVSVIIPIYKVEEYMDECIESVVHQTYKDLEIILVDDGSPDSCPQKCDDWAKRDSRIKVIHKSNGGLSSARNAGIAVATGSYIAFVDSDDWIEPEMYFDMVRAIECMNVDFVAGKVRCYFQESGKVAPFMEGRDRYIIKEDQVLLKDRYRHLLIGNHIECAVWNKLFKRSYIGDCRFCEGRLFEDYLFGYYSTKSMSSMYYLSHTYYNYRIRKNSITTSGKYSDNWEKNFREIKFGIECEGDESLANELKYFQLRHYLDAYRRETDKTTKNGISQTISSLNIKPSILPKRMLVKYMLYKIMVLLC